MWHVYIVRCADESFYTGITTHLSRRIQEHNAGTRKSAKYTRRRTPVTLVYNETYRTRGKALSREWAIKKLTRAAKVRLIAAC